MIDPAVLVPAYDDAAGVTAQFNLNVLSVLNKQLGANFPLEDFRHVALWDAENEWIEMRLEALREVSVHIDDLDLEITSQRASSCAPEISAKFTEEGIAAELASAGFGVRKVWMDQDQRFALLCAQRRERSLIDSKRGFPRLGTTSVRSVPAAQTDLSVYSEAQNGFRPEGERVRHPKLAALTVALTAVLVMPVTQSVAQPFPFDPGSFGNGSTGSLGSDDPDIPIEDTLPQLSVTTLVDGLDHPWDVVAAPDGAILTGQRSGGFFVRRGDNTTGPVAADLSDLYAQSETGLMGIALARDFAQSRTLYTCQGFSAGGVTDVRVIAWTVDAGWTALTRTGNCIARNPGLVRASRGLPNSCGRRTDRCSSGLVTPRRRASRRIRIRWAARSCTSTPTELRRRGIRMLPARSTRSGTATSKAWPCNPEPAGCTRLNRAQASTTKSTCLPPAEITATARIGFPERTTNPCR